MDAIVRVKANYRFSKVDCKAEWRFI